MSLLLTSFATALLALVGVRVASRRDPGGAPVLAFGAVLLLLALPLLAVLPKFHVVLPAADSGPLAAHAPSLPQLGLIWAVGFLVVSLGFLRDQLALTRWRARSVRCHDRRLRDTLTSCREQLGIQGNIGLRFHPGITSPSMAGLTCPAIFLPPVARSWSEDTLRMVLLHELGHLARRDLWGALAARLACLVHWFNPFAWILRRQLLTQCEFACDTFVIAHGANPTIYATALCDVAEGASGSPAAALAMAGPASLRQRVERVVNRPCRRTPLLITAALFLTITASVALSVVRFRSEVPAAGYTPQEVELRLTAEPFPGG